MTRKLSVEEIFNAFIKRIDNLEEEVVNLRNDKISDFFKSVEGANIYATLRSVIDTAIKNNQNPFETIRLIAKCEVTTE